MKNYFPFIFLFSLVVFSQCKQPKAVATVDKSDVWHCQVKELERPIFRTEVIVSDIYYEKDTLRIDLLPKTIENDTSDLIHSIQMHFKYSEMCKEMQYQGKVYFEIRKDSIGNFTQTKVLRGMDGIDGTCTKSVSKELNRILKKAPIVDVKDEIDSFILAIKIVIRED